MTMKDFDGSKEEMYKTLGSGIGATVVTGKINAGLVAGAAGLLLSGPSPEEKARKARVEAEERARAERIRREKEEAERQAALRAKYAAGIKKAECVNVVSGTGANTVYTYYVVKAPDKIIITNVFAIPKQDDGDWPYCTDIDKKLKAQLAKKDPKSIAQYQFFIQKVYKDKSEAETKNENEIAAAESHYWNKSVCHFQPFSNATQKDEDTPPSKHETKGDFWNN